MWIEITEDDVITRLAGAELTAYQTAALGTGQTDPLPDIITGVVREVRSRVAACRANTLGSGATIPDEVLHHALALIRYRLITRLPVGVKEERRKEYEDALAALRDVASCRVTIEQPATASAEVVSSPTPRTTPRPRRFTSGTQEGI
jgi:hypothetical protein